MAERVPILAGAAEANVREIADNVSIDVAIYNNAQALPAETIREIVSRVIEQLCTIRAF